MEVKHGVGAILFFVWCVFFAIGCENNEVAIYEVKLKTMWSEDTFPMDYPNPHVDKVQWSPVFGQSHNKSYALYRVGDIPRPAVQRLMQTGSIDDLMLQSEEEPRIYDQFSAPAVGSGEGETQGLVVVDGGHSLVSLISRMIPTAAWFVGVDSLDLCIESSWVDQITLDLEPLSGGLSTTDAFEGDNLHRTSGAPVTKLNPRALNYRHSRFLKYSKDTTIAKAEFIKKEVYSAEEINKLVRDDVIGKLKQKGFRKVLPRRTDYDSEDDEEFNHGVTTKSNVDRLMDLEEEPFGTPAPNQPENNVVVVTRAPSFGQSEDETSDEEEPMSMDDAVLAVAQGNKLGLKKHLPRHFRSRLTLSTIDHIVIKKPEKSLIIVKHL